MEWVAFFSQPLTQLGGLAALLVSLHKTGIVDVKGLIRAAIGIDEGVKQVNGDNRNGLQVLLSKMEELTQYANHDTTQNLNRVIDAVETLTGLMNTHVREHDKVLYILEDIKTNGTKCRKE